MKLKCKINPFKKPLPKRKPKANKQTNKRSKPKFTYKDLRNGVEMSEGQRLFLIRQEGRRVKNAVKRPRKPVVKKNIYQMLAEGNKIDSIARELNMTVEEINKLMNKA